MATYNKAEHGFDTNFPGGEKPNNILKKQDFLDFAVLVSATPSEETIEDAVVKETRASLGAATGAASGAVIGGAIGWLAGMSLLAISDVGPLTWAGPIMAAFAGFAAGGLFGWLGGVLIGTFIPDLEAKALAIASRFFVQNKPVAAICHGPQILISAHLLQARRATCYKTVADELKDGGALYEDVEVVVDGNLITSRQPSDLPAFMREIMKQIGS